MEYTKQAESGNCIISMNGKFTFSDHEKFREIVDMLNNAEIKSLIIDLSEVEFVDSAALGMLLIAREDAGKGNIDLILQNPTGQIEKMFKISRFDSIFNITKAGSCE